MTFWESRRIWLEIKTPDVFLSFGAGAPQTPAVEVRPAPFRDLLIDGFIPRLFRSCMSKADGEIMWGEFLNSLDEDAKSNYFQGAGGTTINSRIHALASSRQCRTSAFRWVQ